MGLGRRLSLARVRLFGSVAPLLRVTVLGLVACQAPLAPSQEGLLARRAPSDVRRVASAARITDGRVPDEGAPWRSDETAVARGEGAFVEFDLGATKRIRAAWLQADHNDVYVLSASSDGRDFVPVWRAEPTPAGGLRARHRRDLDVRARLVRITPEQGDRAYSISELRLYDQPPRLWPPRIARVQPEPPNARLRTLVGWTAVAWVLLLVLTSRRASVWVLVFGLLPACAVLVSTVRECVARYPLDVWSEAAIRAAVGLVGAVCVVRLAMARGRWPARRGLVLATLAGCAWVAFASFFHFGRPQFYDAARRQPSFVHYLDMRVYFPVAKYFRELGFDGLYVASVAALVEIDPGTTLDTLGETELRDLRNHRVVRVKDVRDHVAEVRGRFGETRWQEFVDDMRYFRGAMGRPLYLASMLDHGGNATPLWLAHAHGLYRGQRARHALLVATGLLDPVLLLLGFAALAWSFGPVAALLCMLVFGACDFPMGGVTNWAGATLRHDWMAAMAFAFSALRREKYAWGGALLALAGFLRAFPAFAFLGLGAAMFAWGVQEWCTTRRVPTWRRLRDAQEPALRTLVGGAIGSLFLFGGSVATLGLNAWPGWLHKVGLLSSEPRVNHMGVRALLNYDFMRDMRASSERALAFDWVGAQARAFAGRIGVYYVFVFVLTLLVVLACRRQPPVRAALLGLCLFVVWLYPANYYIHFVFVLPLLAETPLSLRGFALSPAAAGIWGVLCLMCAAEYLGVVEPYLDRHYFIGSVCLMAALVPCVVLASPELRYFLRSLSARALSRARTRPA